MRLACREQVTPGTLVASHATRLPDVLDVLTRPDIVAQAWDYFRSVQTKDVKYTPLIRPQDMPGDLAQRRNDGDIR
jgi:hypothetical protein